MPNQKVTIVLTDKPSGEVGCEIEFDPPLESGSEATTATLLTMELVEYIGSRINKVEVES